VSNKNILKTNYTVHNDGIINFSANLTFDHLVVVSKMWCYIVIRILQDNNDKNYQKEFIKTVVDVEKAINGVQKNPIVALIAGSFVNSIEQGLKFPLKKVSLNLDRSMN
jgi:hypothetical protein